MTNFLSTKKKSEKNSVLMSCGHGNLVTEPGLDCLVRMYLNREIEKR